MAAEETTNQESADTQAAVDTFNYGTTDDGVEEVAETTTTDDATEGAEVDSASPNAETVEEDSEEVEYEGAKHKVPKALKDAIMRHADYTKKTQEVAEHRKAVEARETALENQAKAQQEYIQEYATLVATSNQIAQYDKVDWQAWNQNDPVAAQAAWFQRTQLIEARAQIAGQIQQKEQTRLREEQKKASEAQQATAKQIRECFETVAREIKGWSPELAKSLDKTASEFGYTNAELQQVKDPRFVRLLHKAHMAEQLLKKQTTAASPLPKPQAKPVPTVGGNAPAKKDHERMSTEEWMVQRRKEVYGR